MEAVKIKAVRRLQFCSGHRVMGHENKCSTPHGHNYVGFFHAEADDLDHLGRVIDFSVLKSRIGGWIEQYWDHAFIAFYNDLSVINSIRQIENVHKPLFISDFNPTAENMAKYLFKIVCPKVLRDTGVKVTKIELYETENCYASIE